MMISLWNWNFSITVSDWMNHIVEQSWIPQSFGNFIFFFFLKCTNSRDGCS